MQIGKTLAAEQLRQQQTSYAMKRGIDNGQPAPPGQSLLFWTAFLGHSVQIILIRRLV